MYLKERLARGATQRRGDRPCRRAGKAAAVIAFSPDILRDCLGQGYTLICAGMDVDRLAEDYGRMREAFRLLVPSQ
jgi:2-keto-3-deoxy-L-rhamnonate aldolase RhmA